LREERSGRWDKSETSQETDGSLRAKPDLNGALIESKDGCVAARVLDVQLDASVGEEVWLKSCSVDVHEGFQEALVASLVSSLVASERTNSEWAAVLEVLWKEAEFPVAGGESSCGGASQKNVEVDANALNGDQWEGSSSEGFLLKVSWEVPFVNGVEFAGCVSLE